MKVGGKKMLPRVQQAPKSSNKMKQEFFSKGVKMAVAKNTIIQICDTCKVSPDTFRDMGAACGQLVRVCTGPEDAEGRIFKISPGNKMLKGVVGLPTGFPKTITHVILKHCQGMEVQRAAELIAETSSIVTKGVKQVLLEHLAGKVLQTAGTNISFTVLGTEYSFVVKRPLDTTLRAQYVTTETNVIFKSESSGVVEPSHVERPTQFPVAHWETLLAGNVKKITLEGETGVGKTYCAEKWCKLHHDTWITLTDANINDGALGRARNVIKNSAPCCVIVDNVQSDDSVLSIEDLMELDKDDSAVVVVCKTSEGSGKMKQLGYAVPLETPSNAAERTQLLRQIIDVKKANLKRDFDAADVEAAASKTHGFTAGDLSMLVSYSVMVDGSLVSAAGKLRPSSLKTLDISVPSVRWSDVGGQDEVKQLLKECVEWPLKHSDMFRKLSIKPPSGVLLYGPPGCSKTLLAKALATECTYNFIAVKGPELYDKYVGESEKAVRNVFSKARAAAPTVIFFDEIDGMCGKRGSGGVTDRVISQFLTEMDGLPAQNTKNHVIVLAATNRPDNIDPALMRPGRIDRKVYITLPTETAILDICNITLKDIPLAPNVDLSKVASLLVGRSGAEVVSALKESVLTCLNRDSSAVCVDQRDLIRGLRKVQPRTNAQDLAFYEAWGSKGK